MNQSDALITDYFAPPTDGLWRWTYDGLAVVTPNGKTLGFKQEIEEILQRLATRGLPPFGAIVMLLAACRDNWAQNIEFRTAMLNIPRTEKTREPFIVAAGAHGRDVKDDKIFAAAMQAYDGFVDTKSRDMLGEFDRVALLGPDLRKSAEAKAFIAESVFETAETILSPADAADLVRHFGQGITPELLAPVTRDAGVVFLRDLTALEGLKRLSRENLELRSKTGLDRLVIPAGDIELPPPQRVRNLLDALRIDPDPELAGLARLAQNLMAAVHVPRTLTPDDELPLGGFTDIANRGPLDRLLASELVHDDLTLAVRVALNEALYLRRESPPRSPPEQRAMLLDSGIRMWGLPRVFGAAVALALTATTGDKVAVRSYRAGAGTVVSTDLTTRDGLVAHLAALEAAPHPGSAMKPFFEAVERIGTASDTIFITHPDTLADPDFRAALALIPDLNFHAATVDRDGVFRFLHIASNGQTLLREARLSLDAMLASDPAGARAEGVPLKDVALNPDLPAILAVRPFPFLMPHNLDPVRVARSLKHGLVSLTDDGRLTQWLRPGRGPYELSTTVPRGDLVKLLIRNENEALAVLDSPQDSRLLVYRFLIESGKASTLTLPPRKRPLRHARLHGDVLILIYGNEIDAFYLSSGMHFDTYAMQVNLRWMGGRFFKISNGWFALDVSQGRIRFESAGKMPADTIALIDRAGLDGPWALTKSGVLASSIGGGPAIRFPLKHRITELKGVSENGDLLVVQLDETIAGQVHLLNARDGSVRVFTGVWHLLLDPDILDLTTNAPSLRKQVARVAIAQNGNIVLYSPHGIPFEIYLNDKEKLAIRDSNEPEHSAAGTATITGALPFHAAIQSRNSTRDSSLVIPLAAGPVEFKPVPGPPDVRYSLSMARFPDGSRIFFDSRGLLHLKSSNPAQPEISLVLSTRQVACWSSDSEQCGDSYCINPLGVTQFLVKDSRFKDKILRFTERLI